MKSKAVLLGMFVIVGLLAVVSCSRSTKSNDQKSPLIRGRVLNESGKSVSNAAVMLCYNFETMDFSFVPKEDNHGIPVEYSLRQNYPNPFNSVTGIPFTLPEECHVELWIMDYCEKDTVRILVDEIQSAGLYIVTWDGKNEEGKLVVNGVYYYNIVCGDYSDKKAMILSFSYLGYSSLDSLEHHALTNKDGYFEISQDCLPFGFESVKTDSTGNPIGTIVISREVDIWALHNSYSPACVESVFVDSLSGAYITIQLSD